MEAWKAIGRYGQEDDDNGVMDEWTNGVILSDYVTNSEEMEWHNDKEKREGYWYNEQANMVLEK
jgi:hypothetical protein